MIERLDQLMLNDLIEVSCGNMAPLGCDDRAEEVKVANKIIAEYLSIAQPIAAKMHLSESEDGTKLSMREKCLRICLLLCNLGQAQRAKEVLLELGVSEAHLKDDDAIRLRCQAMLDDVQYEIRRAKEMKDEQRKKSKEPQDIRKGWYGEIAFVMSTLKMSFDPATMNAAIYANLVRQAVEKTKQMAKMPRAMGLF